MYARPSEFLHTTSTQVACVGPRAYDCLELGVTGGYELPGVDAGNAAQVLSKYS